ncbi:MAG: dihydrolipoyl dehydrogenase [Nitrososphaeria archaeon]
MGYKVIVVGAGPAGYVAAIRLAQLGLKTAVVERHYLGGECTNYGCIPTKALIESTNLYWKIKRADEIGVHAEPEYDLQAFKAWKEKIVSQLRNGIGILLEENGVELVEGEASLRSPKNVVVKRGGESIELETENVVVATGSTPIELPNTPFDGKNVVSSREMFSLEKLPESILVIGGGAIGVEFASALTKVGVQVYLVEMMPQLLPGFDKEAARYLLRSLTRLGVKVYTNSTVSSYKSSNGLLEIRIGKPGGEETLKARKILVAVGRRPYSSIGLKEVGLALDEKGHAIVDTRMATNVAGIHAVGDVAGPPYLAHKAFKQGLVAAEVIAGEDVTYDFRAVPNVVFSDPEVVSVGLSEEDAKKLGLDIFVGRFPLQASARALTENSPEGFFKIVAEKNSLRVVGVQMVGVKVSELAGEAAMAIELGLNVKDVASTMHPHPTISEAFMEAAEEALSRPVHTLKKR